MFDCTLINDQVKKNERPGNIPDEIINPTRPPIHSTGVLQLHIISELVMNPGWQPCSHCFYLPETQK
jgi:hypothetical protein